MHDWNAIEHIVVLILENRSFDCILGRLYPRDPSFEGVSENDTNAWLGGRIHAWSSGDPLDDHSASIPCPDPGEHFTEMTAQLYDDTNWGSGPPPMSGFVANYLAQKPTPPHADAVMHFFTPAQLPVITTLAKAFGVCDQWHASAPCQTWPNRFFAHTGTSLGHVDNRTFPIPFGAPSIFNQLTGNGIDWRVYFHDIPQALLLADIWREAPLRFRYFKTFLSDAHNGTLPRYSFIEPQYFTDLFSNLIPNDQHPPHNVLQGEQLIARVYNALRSSPCWKKLLFVITYDEHGGCYDHVPPPVAVPPDTNHQAGFAFDRYGVRVPTVIVSPFMPSGSKVRVAPAGLPDRGPPYPFDHCSILATLRTRFGLGSPLTKRDAVAPHLLTTLSLDDPTNDGPPSVSPTPTKSAIPLLQRLASAVPNHMQSALSQMAALLPTAPLLAGGATPAPTALGPPVSSTVAQAQAMAVQRVRSFLDL